MIIQDTLASTLHPNLTALEDWQHRIHDNAPGIGESNQDRGIHT
jgi:hypothetical protein